MAGKLFGQNFEGQITYNNSYVSKMPNVSDQQLTLMMGSVQNYFIKGGDYKSNFNGSMMQWQLYRKAENKLYNQFASSITVFWYDGSKNQDSLIKYEVIQNAETILGYTCDELILTCISGIQKYYFSSHLSLDGNLYRSHKYGNWSEYITRSNAVPLKVVIENTQFTLESTAIEVRQMTLNPSVFALPENSTVAQGSN